VTIPDRSDNAPIATLLTTPLEDTHTVASIKLLLNLVRTLYRCPWPTPLPSIVTLTDPVDAMFARDKLLGATASIVIAPVTVLACQPEVVTTRREDQTPAPTLPTRPLSDTHTVPHNPLPPARPVALYHALPVLRLTTVTWVDPDDAAFISTAVDIDTASVVNAAVREFSCHPVVTTTRRIVQTLAPGLPLTDVSDCHAVNAHSVPPTRTLPL
jgi:hypothetical protein